MVGLVPQAVFLVSLRTSSFPAGNDVYGKAIESSFLAGNELNITVSLKCCNKI